MPTANSSLCWQLFSNTQFMQPQPLLSLISWEFMKWNIVSVSVTKNLLVKILLWKLHNSNTQGDVLILPIWTTRHTAHFSIILAALTSLLSSATSTEGFIIDCECNLHFTKISEVKQQGLFYYIEINTKLCISNKKQVLMS